MIDFEKIDWSNGGGFPLSAANLNRLEEGIDGSVKLTNKMTSHWWKKIKLKNSTYKLSSDVYYNLYYYVWETSGEEGTFFFSDSISVKEDSETGEVYIDLVNPTSKTVSYNSLSSISMTEKYFIYGTSTTKNGVTMYYGGSIYDIKDTTKQPVYGFSLSGVKIVKPDATYENTGFASSDVEDYYPNGWNKADSTFYTYLGIPFENGRETGRILTGWYYGDGEEARQISVGNRPKIVFLYKQVGSNYEVSYAPYCFGLATEEFSFGGISLTSEGFLVGIDTLSKTNGKGLKYGYVVFY